MPRHADVKVPSPKSTLSSHAQRDPVRPLAIPALQRAELGGSQLNAADVTYLQRAIGNQSVTRLLQAQSPAPIQRAMSVGPANDRFEQEADQIASQLTGKSAGGGQTTSVASAKKGSNVQRDGEESAPMGAEGGALDGALSQRIQRNQGSGSPMPNHVRAKLEPSLGADLGGVRLHTGPDAVQLNRELGSRAFTHQNHIYYGAGQSPNDLSLTTHETVHTIQQGAIRQSRPDGVQRHFGAPRRIMRAPMPHLVQRTLTVANKTIKKTKEAWQGIRGTDFKPAGGWSKEHKKRLKLWVNRKDVYSPVQWYMTGQSQTFFDWPEMAHALDAHVRAQANRKREKKAAQKESKSPIIRRNLGDAMVTIARWIEQAYPQAIIAPPGYRKPARGFGSVWSYLEQFKGQYAHWYPSGKVRSRMKTPLLNHVSTNFAMLREILYALGGVELADLPDDEIDTFLQMLQQYKTLGAKLNDPEQQGKITKKDRQDFMSAQTKLSPKAVESIEPYSDDYGEARFGRGMDKTGKVGGTRIDKDGDFQEGGYQFQETRRDDMTPETFHPWVRFAQARNLPLRAGASNTTDRLLYMAGLAGVGPKGKQAISWAGFIFWNKKYKKIQGSGHTFHEVMDIANVNHNVPYDIDGTDPYKFKEVDDSGGVGDLEESSDHDNVSGSEKDQESDESDSSDEGLKDKPTVTTPSSKPLAKKDKQIQENTPIVSKLSEIDIDTLKMDMWNRNFERFFTPEEITQILRTPQEIDLLAKLLEDSSAFIEKDLRQALAGGDKGKNVTKPTNVNTIAQVLDDETESSEEDMQIIPQTVTSPSSKGSVELPQEKKVYKTVKEMTIQSRRGVMVKIPPGCDLMVVKIYGADEIEIEAIVDRSRGHDGNVRGSTSAAILSPALGL